MASYEDDHNLPRAATTSTSAPRPRHRLDLTDFFASLHSSSSSARDADPFTLLAEQFRRLPETPLVQGLVSQLVSGPKAAEGVPDSFFDTLERVGRGRLGERECPICAEKFADDPYPLVVRLPCHPDHWFDLECIQPWLKLQTTCPLDRKDVVRKRTPPPPPADDDEEEDWDENYA